MTPQEESEILDRLESLPRERAVAILREALAHMAESTPPVKTTEQRLANFSFFNHA